MAERARCRWALGVLVAAIISGMAGGMLGRAGVPDVVRAQEPRSEEELRVWSGQTFTITPDLRNLEVDRWIMENDSTILFHPDVREWRIAADEARFGLGAKIVGAGRDGGDGEEPGDPGQRGRDGVSVKIAMGLLSNGGLRIDVRGGNGGRGAKGGEGWRGERARCPPLYRHGEDGHPGGSGGRGGDGGNGGSVDIDYWILENTDRIDEIDVDNLGGKAGKGGEGGDGGPGGRSVRCFKIGGVGQGQRGARGPVGKSGGRGSKGTRSIDALAERPPDEVASVSVVHNGSSLSVTWEAVVGATHYDVTYYGNGVNARAAWNRPGTSLTVTCDIRPDYQGQNCVVAGATYTVGVRARNAGGESEWRDSTPAVLGVPPGSAR